MSEYSRATLVEGDNYLVADYVYDLRTKRFGPKPPESQWVVFEAPVGKRAYAGFCTNTLSKIDSEVSTTDWDGNPKTVLLSGVVPTDEFRKGIIEIISHVAPGNSFILADDRNGISGATWTNVRKAFKNAGEVIDIGKPMTASTRRDAEKAQLDFVNKVFTKHGKKIMPQAASALLGMGPAEPWYILGEADKISSNVDCGIITKSHVEELAFPISTEYWGMASSLHTGSQLAVIKAAEKVLANGMPYEYVIHTCTKQIRWQLIAAHLWTYGSLSATSLMRFSDKDCALERATAIMKDDKIRDRYFPDGRKALKTELEKRHASLTDNNAKELVGFVEKVLVRRLDKSEVLPTAVIRYVLAIDAAEETRLASQDVRVQARIFRELVEKVLWR